MHFLRLKPQIFLSRIYNVLANVSLPSIKTVAVNYICFCDDTDVLPMYEVNSCTVPNSQIKTALRDRLI